MRRDEGRLAFEGTGGGRETSAIFQRRHEFIRRLREPMCWHSEVDSATMFWVKPKELV